MKKIYLICPVRRIKPEQKEFIIRYMMGLVNAGHSVHSWLNVDQTDPTGYNIVMSHLNGMDTCDEVHLFWDNNSSGSHVDLGMAIALRKPIKLILQYNSDTKHKSYLNVIKEIEAKGYK
jgi:nucleoside 2-deoxyribosyltransferase